MQEMKRMRQALGWSQQRLADESGVNKATINQVEQGKRTPGIQTLEKLAAAMDAEIGDFFPKAQAPLPLEMDGGRGLQLWDQHAANIAEDLEELSKGAESEKWERRFGRREGAGIAAKGTIEVIEQLLDLIKSGAISVSREEALSLLRSGARLAKAADRLDELSAPSEEDIVRGVKERGERFANEARFQAVVKTLELSDRDREEIFA